MSGFNGLKSMLYSRKVFWATFGVIQALVLHYLNVPDDVWKSIAALVGVLITSIAVEDAATKLNK